MKDTVHTANPVRVSLPASVAADIGSLKKAVGSILDKLGCQACCSGHDIFFELQRDLVLPTKLSARAELTASSRAARAVTGRRSAASAIRVGIKPEVAASIDDVFLAIDRIAELSGHPACATGCDMFFQLERSFVMDEALAIKEQVMTLGQ